MITLLIAGASVRAAVGSADRSGTYELLAADMFNDHDLARACRSSRVDSRYGNLSQLAARERPDFWMYTGAMENHPAVIAEVSQHTRLLGNDAATVRRIRSPSEFARALKLADVRCPEYRTDVCPGQGVWLRKPIRSAAGFGIRPAVPGEPHEVGVLFQRLIPGTPCSAVFVAHRRAAQLLGTTQQLSGDASFGATSFQYCGSIGPRPLTHGIEQQWQRIGNCLASSFELKGLFGVDAIVSNGQVVPVEVNPRYTASIEVLEAGQLWSSIDLHVSACLDEEVADVTRRPNSPYFGKAIIFARRKLTMTEEQIAWIDQVNRSSAAPVVADIPRANISIRVGQPILTVLAHSHTIDRVLAQLQKRAAEITTKLERNVRE